MQHTVLIWISYTANIQNLRILVLQQEPASAESDVKQHSMSWAKTVHCDNLYTFSLCMHYSKSKHLHRCSVWKGWRREDEWIGRQEDCV